MWTRWAMRYCSSRRVIILKITLKILYCIGNFQLFNLNCQASCLYIHTHISCSSSISSVLCLLCRSFSQSQEENRQGKRGTPSLFFSTITRLGTLEFLYAEVILVKLLFVLYFSGIASPCGSSLFLKLVLSLYYMPSGLAIYLLRFFFLFILFFGLFMLFIILFYFILFHFMIVVTEYRDLSLAYTYSAACHVPFFY